MNIQKIRVLHSLIFGLALIFAGLAMNSTVHAQGGFIVEDDEVVTAALNTSLSSRSARNGARFTMTVRSPSQYRGATLYGHISNVERAGRVRGRSEMTLNFDRIRLRNGRTYRFAGTVETVRMANGERVEIDNEGGVNEDNNQTRRTAGRTAAGAGVGAVIGAIAGGGSGAAIGAAVGGGIGAGSSVIQGGDNLELSRGTIVTIRASAPRR